ncbi:MAG TPA: cation transporter [Chthoniobacterales bacterium]|jgi:divalent metal cation (Fe/Co/Zn/Cd) transporter|nr:cation transporter [Chthoniobacterales bacterium]
MSEAIVFERSSALRAALRLEIITGVWMVIEAAVAVAAGIFAHSLLLIAFGIDSAIELASAILVFRRFRIESHEKFASDLEDAGAIERKTTRIAGYLLFLLSAYVVVQAIFGLATRHAAETSPIGIAVAVIAAVGMPLLAKAKLRVAERADSRSLRADAMEALTCGYLAWILLLGLALNAVTRWWWIDPVASLAIVPLLVREGWGAVFGESCSN